jgi:hypothetical protein
MIVGAIVGAFVLLAGLMFAVQVLFVVTGLVHDP